VHQWLKNLLLFVPLLTAFSFQDIDNLLSAVLAFLAFSLAASATYMGNDCWDLDSDRTHPRKKFRPFASGQIPILKGIVVAVVLLMLGLLLAYHVSLHFLWMLLLYLATTTTYTWTLKAYVLIDVLVLSLLYTLRIIAGSIAVGVATSTWLLAFSVFIFFSLALVKRCSELVTLQQTGRQATHGRDYRTSDLAVLWPLGISSALSAVVVFGLFISAPETQARYASPQGLWLVAIGLIYWLARLWIKTSRGEMHDDPLVFAVRDFGSRLTILAMVTATLVAHFLPLG
jgi:4-hydroxybenzoate polyprenyltransferase